MRVIAATILAVSLGLSSLPVHAQAWGTQTAAQTEAGWMERLWQWIEALWTPAAPLERIQENSTGVGTATRPDSATPTRLDRGVTVDPNG
jgi:hypothetical protein